MEPIQYKLPHRPKAGPDIFFNHPLKVPEHPEVQVRVSFAVKETFCKFVLFCFPSWETSLHRTKPIGRGFKHQQHFYLGLAASGLAFVSLVIAIPLAFQSLSPWRLQWDVGTLMCALWSSPHYKAHCAISFKVSLSAKKDARRLTLRLAIQPLEGLEAS